MKRKISALIFALILTLALVPAIAAENAEEAVFISVSARHYHNLAIKSDGSLWAWGNNNYGQLGDNTVESKLTPVKIMENVIAADAGRGHSLAITYDGSLWTWGLYENGRWRLGDSATGENNLTPVKIMDNVKAISAGDNHHNFATKNDGSLWAWGVNYGRLGDGTTNFVSQWEPVKILDDVVAVSARWAHSLAIKSDGSLWAWGGNGAGQIGDGTVTISSGRHPRVTEDHNKLTPVKIMDDVKTISVGGWHSLVIKNDNSLWAWGGNIDGQIGDGTTISKSMPVKIMDDVKAVSAGEQHNLVIKNDNSLWAWGNNDYGQLGDGTTVDKLTPVKIMDDVTAVSAGRTHSLVIKNDGSILLWGRQEREQNGDGTTESNLTIISPTTGDNTAIIIFLFAVVILTVMNYKIIKQKKILKRKNL